MRAKQLLMALAGFVLGLPGLIQAQSIRFSDVYISAGMNWSQPSGSLSDFQKLAPNSAILNNDFSGFTSSDYYYYSGHQAEGRASFLVGIDFKNKETGEFGGTPQLRVGLTYSSGVSLSYNLWNETRTTYDTLTSSRTGNKAYVDSIYSESYAMDYSTENLMLDVSLVFKTNPDARWSLYGGIGVAAGLSFNARTFVSEYQYSSISNQGQYYDKYYNDNYDGNDEYESFRNENTFLLTGYIPLGVDFRIGKKSEFWKRTHLFFELRPAINYSHIPELGNYVQGSLQHSFGIRIT